MRTAGEVAAVLQQIMNHDPGHFAIVASDASALASWAGRAVKAAGAVDQGVERIQHRWSGLPASLEAPGAVEPLYTAMDAPLRMANHQLASVKTVAAVLEPLAEAIVLAKRDFAALWTDCARLRDEAQAQAAADQLAAAVAQRQRVEQGQSPSGIGILSDEGPAQPALSARLDGLVARLATTNETWKQAKDTAIDGLRSARATLDPNLVAGSATGTTSGLSAADAPTGVDGLTMGLGWFAGLERGNRVFTAQDAFTQRMRHDATVVRARDNALDQLMAGHGQVGTPLAGTPSRELSSLGALPSGLVDLTTIFATMNARAARSAGIPVPDALVDGHVPGDIDSAFLGSYGVTVVPIRISSERNKAVVRFTVTNTTTAASGTRLPTDALDPLDPLVESRKNELAQDVGRAESTQTITWTETLAWPASTSSAARPRAPRPIGVQ